MADSPLSDSTGLCHPGWSVCGDRHGVLGVLFEGRRRASRIPGDDAPARRGSGTCPGRSSSVRVPRAADRHRCPGSNRHRNVSISQMGRNCRKIAWTSREHVFHNLRSLLPHLSFGFLLFVFCSFPGPSLSYVIARIITRSASPSAWFSGCLIGDILGFDDDFSR